MGSQQPMMIEGHTAEGELPSPPLIGPTAFAPLVTGSFRGTATGAGRASTVSPDGASAYSDTPFSGADAAVMAEAFRKALRKPDFADRPVEEGESPEGHTDEPPELLNRELAEEGRDIRSVGSSRGVKVEGTNNDFEGQ